MDPLLQLISELYAGVNELRAQRDAAVHERDELQAKVAQLTSESAG